LSLAEEIEVVVLLAAVSASAQRNAIVVGDDRV
jgi:hypothetical protein